MRNGVIFPTRGSGQPRIPINISPARKVVECLNY
jgi:hypothetical protein